MKKQLLLGVALLGIIACNAYAADDAAPADHNAGAKPAAPSADNGAKPAKHHHHKTDKDKGQDEAKKQDSTPAPVSALREGR